MDEKRNANHGGRVPARGRPARASEQPRDEQRDQQRRDEVSDLTDIKALAASSRAGAVPSARQNAAELSGFVARRESLVGMRVLSGSAAGSGLPNWVWGAAGCLSVVAVGLGAFSLFNVPELFARSGSSPVGPTAPAVGSPRIDEPPRIEPIVRPLTDPASARPIATALAPEAASGSPVKPLRKLPKTPPALDAVPSTTAPNEAPAASLPVPSPSGKKAADERPTGATPTKSESAPNPRRDVKSALNELHPKVTQCFQRFQIPGVARVNLLVDPSGAIEPVLSGEFEGTPTGACVLQELSSATLPPFRGAPVQLTHAFILH